MNGQGKKKGKKQWVKVQRKDTLKLSGDGDFVEVMSAKTKRMGFLLLMGQPIKEPIAWRGPFVMKLSTRSCSSINASNNHRRYCSSSISTQQEIQQCFVDYNNGKLATVKGKSVIY